MSAFSKLRWYARKPVAVIMAASLVTSTVPVVNLMEAAPAYAAPSERSMASQGVSWDLSEPLSLTFDTHPAQGEDGAATATVSKDAILSYLEGQLSQQFKYIPGDEGTGDLYSIAVNNALDGLQEQLEQQLNDEAEPGTTVSVSDITLDESSLEYQFVDAEIELVGSSDPNLEVVPNEDGSWTVSTGTAVSDATITFNVKTVTYQIRFDYTYTKTTTTEGGGEDVTEPGTGGDVTEPGSGDAGSGSGDEPGSGNAGSGDAGVDVDGSADEPVVETGIEGFYPGPGTDSWSGDLKMDFGTAPRQLTTSAVTSVDAWAGVGDAIDAAQPVVSGLKYAFLNPTSATSTLVTAPEGLEYEIENDRSNNRYFSSKIRYENGAYVIVVTPKRAFRNQDEDKTITVSFTYPDGTEAGTIAVTVDPIAPETIDLSTLETEALDFRMASDQLDDILAAANQAVSDATGGELTDYYSAVAFTDSGLQKYYAADGQSLTSEDLTFTPRDSKGTEEDEDPIDNFAFTGNLTVKMKPMEVIDWSPESGDRNSLASNLTITGDSLKDDTTLDAPSMTADGTWFRTDATVAWSGGSVVDTGGSMTPTDGLVFASNVTLEHEGQQTQSGSFFVQDSESGIVRRVDGVEYLYDGVDPELVSFEAAGRDGERSVTTSDGNVFAAEHVDVQFTLSEGDASLEGGSSGVNNVSLSYEQEASSGSAETKTNSDMKPSSGDRTYEFTIDDDSKVSTDTISIDVQDKAGNVGENLGADDATVPYDVAEMVSMTTAPTIATSWDTSNAHNGQYYNTNRTVTFTVHAPFFEYTQEYLSGDVMATITKDGSAWKTITPGDFTKVGDDTWSCTISFTEDGDYVLSGVQVSDVIGRTSTAAGDTFTIDKTTPTMQVSFDNNNVANGKYYNAARTATITITEHNFDPSLVHITPTAGAGNGGEVGQPSISGWSTSGDVHTATVTFPGQGVYTLSVDGMDLATNELTPYTCPEFVVDTLTPEITISGVENMTAYQGDVNPSVAVHDTNLDSATDIHVQVVGTSPYGEEANPFTNDPSITATDASVSYRNPADVKANDNVYTVVVNAVDLAGNTSDDAVTFSVNRFGSTYVISDETGKMLNEYLKFDDTTDVRVTEINPSGLDASQTAVELTRDTSNTTLSADDYTVEQGSASGWQEYVYTVNRDNYDTDGVYRVLFHSQDRAGNVSENEMEGKNAADDGASAQINFAVDDTAPLASFVDLSNTEPYNESSHVAKVTFEDNLMLDHAVVEINGEEVATFDAEQLAQSATQEFTINESTGNQSVRVTVYDAAGNEGEAVMDNVVVTTNAFELWRRNTPLFAGTIAVAVLAAAGVIFVVAKKRSKDDEAEA